MKITSARARRIGILGAMLLRTLGPTWRIRVHGHHLDVTRRDVILAFFHGDMLVPAVLYRRHPAAIMISEHGDGELIAQAVRRLGCHLPVRGSSTRGGARAFLEMVKTRAEMPWAITPDGPRGPRGRVHDGVILLASEGRREIIPAGYAVSRGVRFKSWDRFVVPLPFARITAYLGEPLAVPADVGRDQRKALAHELEARLSSVNDAANEALASW